MGIQIGARARGVGDADRGMRGGGDVEGHGEARAREMTRNAMRQRGGSPWEHGSCEGGRGTLSKYSFLCFSKSCCVWPCFFALGAAPTAMLPLMTKAHGSDLSMSSICLAILLALSYAFRSMSSRAKGKGMSSGFAGQVVPRLRPSSSFSPPSPSMPLITCCQRAKVRALEGSWRLRRLVIWTGDGSMWLHVVREPQGRQGGSTWGRPTHPWQRGPLRWWGISQRHCSANPSRTSLHQCRGYVAYPGQEQR